MIVYRVSVLLAGLVLPFAAFGHHSFATIFNPAIITELEGEITEVRWRNPHVSFTLKTVDGSGVETLWGVETHSLSIMRRMDLATAFIHVGDEVKVAGNPARRSDLNAMFVQNILLPNGSEWVFRGSAGPKQGFLFNKDDLTVLLPRQVEGNGHPHYSSSDDYCVGRCAHPHTSTELNRIDLRELFH